MDVVSFLGSAGAGAWLGPFNKPFPFQPVYQLLPFQPMLCLLPMFQPPLETTGSGGRAFPLER